MQTRVAIIQAAPVAFDRGATLERLSGLVGQAAGDGTELVVVPEAFVSGYPKGLSFGAEVGLRTEEGRRLFRRYYESAVDVPGDATESMGGMAREHGIFMVIGVIERERGTLYCTALFFGPDGRLLGKHRKLLPTGQERVIWGRGDGSTLTVVDTPLGKVGAVICWENYMPLLRAAMYAKGVQIYCAPTVDDRESWVPTMRHIAVEGRCYVVSACQFARRADYPAHYETRFGDDPDTVLIRGGSCIVDPFGNVIAGPVYDEQAVVAASLDLGRIIEGKYDLDVAGHYARPDVFRLEVDERSQPEKD